MFSGNVIHMNNWHLANSSGRLILSHPSHALANEVMKHSCSVKGNPSLASLCNTLGRIPHLADSPDFPGVRLGCIWPAVDFHFCFYCSTNPALPLHPSLFHVESTEKFVLFPAPCSPCYKELQEDIYTAKKNPRQQVSQPGSAD